MAELVTSVFGGHSEAVRLALSKKRGEAYPGAADTSGENFSAFDAPLFPPERSPMPTPAVRVDRTKSDTVVAIRASVAKLSPLTLRRLREGLFRLELQLVGEMIAGGVDVPRVTALSHCARAIEVVDLLQSGVRERPQRP
jgi:hypothetical protein